MSDGVAETATADAVEGGSSSTVAGDRRRDAVGHLQEFYGFIIAAGLALAVPRVIVGRDDGTLSVEATSLALFIGLLVTAVPFYHGAVLHLRKQYTERAARAPAATVLVDFAFLIVEAVIFVALAEALPAPPTFAVVFVMLLAVDIAFAFVSLRLDGQLAAAHWQRALLRSLGSLSDWRRGEGPSSWLRVNVGALLVGGVILVGVGLGAPSSAVVTALVVTMLARSAIDYWINLDFYTGEEGVADSVPAVSGAPPSNVG